MKNERILDMLGQVDEKYILEAAPGTPSSVKKINWTKWGAWGAMAACACLVFYVGSQVVFFGGSTDTACESTAGASIEDNGYGFAESPKQENAKQEAAQDGAMAESAPAEEITHSEASKMEAEYAGSEAFTEEPKNGESASSAAPEENVEINWGVTLAVENVTPIGLTLICTQSGGEYTGELQAGSYYELQQAVGDIIWEEVPYIVEKIAWTDEAYLIPKDGSTRWELDWENIYGQLPAGRYRLVKSIMDVREPGDYDKEIFFVEFIIE